VPNVGARGPTVGLTTELEEYFFKQLEALRKNDGKAREREEDSSAPGHLFAVIVEALRLDRLRETGATFSYPDALTPVQWAALDALTIARRRDQQEDFESKRQDQQERERRQRAAQMATDLGRQMRNK
jgi:hypothetical protein